MKKIKSITVSPGEFEACWIASETIAIKEGTYSICGDPYPCFNIMKNGELASEVRCVHNIIIEYKEEIKEIKLVEYNCIFCKKEMGDTLTCPHCNEENPF